MPGCAACLSAGPWASQGERIPGVWLYGGGSGAAPVTLELAMGVPGSVVGSHYPLCVDQGCVGLRGVS